MEYLLGLAVAGGLLFSVYQLGYSQGRIDGYNQCYNLTRVIYKNQMEGKQDDNS